VKPATEKAKSSSHPSACIGNWNLLCLGLSLQSFSS